MNYIELDQKYIANTYKRADVVLVEGTSSTATDIDGKKYIDFTSGIGVNSLGFSDPNWAKAVADQAQKMQHISNLYYTTPCIELAEKLCTMTGFEKVFFGNSGAEANEGAIKIARKYSFEKYGEGRYKVLSLQNSFHGRTITTLKATGQEYFHNYFFPFTEGFDYAPAHDADATIEMLKVGGFCAVMVEVVQGEGGVIALSKDYVNAVYDYCKANDILFIVDEVQTGIGRTGTMLAHEQFGIKPDVVTLAKGLGGGLPIGAFLLAESTKDVFKYSDHGTTFGGNPVVCAGAKVVLESLDLAEITKKGEYFRAKLEAIEEVESVTGLGMMIGIKPKTKEVGAILGECLANGLIVLSAKDKVRLLPPLNISYAEIDAGLEILASVLNK
ncbi:MAG: acetylornithine/succinylornithine family transaminase [Clostridia bacterium]